MFQNLVQHVETALFVQLRVFHDEGNYTPIRTVHPENTYCKNPKKFNINNKSNFILKYFWHISGDMANFSAILEWRAKIENQILTSQFLSLKWLWEKKKENSKQLWSRTSHAPIHVLMWLCITISCLKQILNKGYRMDSLERGPSIYKSKEKFVPAFASANMKRSIAASIDQIHGVIWRIATRSMIQ